jgi:hypothetical protein
MGLYAFDGTWNEKKTDDDLKYKNTNVCRFHDAYQKNTGRSEFYVEGVGTRYDILGKIIGGVFGAGVLPRLHEAYDHLCKAWASGDQVIDIVGFSRGAAICLDFCHLIQERGIRDPESETVVEPNPQIRFLGVWDIVASFGLANLGIGFNIGHHLKLPKARLQYCCHALALDERRPSFVATRLPGAREVWFRGVHSDIGGGNGNRGRNDITLRWMMAKAKAAGLPITDADIAALKPDPAAKPHLKGALVVNVRHVSKVDRVHHTIAGFVGKGIRQPPASCPFETDQDEQTIVELGANGIDLFPDDVRAKIKVLATQATETAEQEGVPLGEAQEAVLALIQNRIPLVVSDQELAIARQSTADLVATMVSQMKKDGMMALHPLMLTQALLRFSSLFPYLD